MGEERGINRTIMTQEKWGIKTGHGRGKKREAGKNTGWGFVEHWQSGAPEGRQFFSAKVTKGGNRGAPVQRKIQGNGKKKNPD